MRKTIIALGVLAVLVVVAGLRLSSALDSGGPPPEPVPQTLDDIFAQMAREAPGFAGMFFEGEVLQVVLKDPTPERRAAAERAVTALLEAQGRSLPSTIVIVPAQHDFLQLKEWYDRIRPVVLGMKGVISTDLDEAKNRLSIGVATLEARGLVEQKLAEIGIPREVVNIEIVEPIVEQSSLRDYHRPLRGGLQIISDSRVCTLGFIGDRQGTRGFVTAPSLFFADWRG